MFCFVSKVLHSKNVNTIPSSCTYKLSQNSNYEIGDCLYDEGIAQNYAFRLSWNFHTNVWTIIAIPSCTNNTSNQFFV